MSEFSADTMGLGHLESDELSVECQARNIDPLRGHASQKLAAMMNEESAGMREKPLLPHPLKLTSEIALCKRKLSQIEEERKRHDADGVVEALEVLRSRAKHLVARLERLVNYAVDNATIPPILKNARLLLERLVPASAGDGTPNISFEEEFLGFAESGTARCDTNSRRSTGAIPKATNNVPVNQQGPATQAALNDPVIIATGRASFPPLNQSAPPSAFQSFVSSGAQNRPNSRSAAASSCNVDPHPAPVRIRPGLTHTLSKWTVRFSGGLKDLAVDEFFFRVENLATADNVHADSLLLGLHCFSLETRPISTGCKVVKIQTILGLLLKDR